MGSGGVACVASNEGAQGAGASAIDPPTSDDRQAAVAAAVGFLRALLASTRDPGAAAGLSAAAGRAVDGDLLRNLIERERVGPLLHRALRGRSLLSPATHAALLESYRVTALRNLVLLHELGTCLEHLGAAGVAAIVLKGAALAQPVYGSLAVRPMCDLDILIHQRDLPRARTVIEALGFRPMRLETHAGALAEHENELAFEKPGRLPVELDVHWSLLDSPFYQRELAMEWFWDSARIQSLGSSSAPTLGVEALLLHLCAHLMLHHQGNGLLWWNDIAEVLSVESRAIDWREVFARSCAYQLLLPMREALTHLAAEWAAPIPAEVLRQFAEARPSTAEADVFARLSGAESAGQRFWSDLRGMGSWRRGLHYARTNLLPSVAYMRRRYGIRHRWLVPLYYPYRWLRGLRGTGWRGTRGV
jgi:Uncharacterised nucleotidyltransferase